MKVFDDLDKEQADMYRWVRRNLSASMFVLLTGKEVTTKEFLEMPELEIDRHLRTAYETDYAARSTSSLNERSKIRSGILPPALGHALAKYTTAIEESVLFQEGLGGKTFSDVNREAEESLLELCEQMARLR